MRLFLVLSLMFYYCQFAFAQSENAKSVESSTTEKSVIYIPADKRHQGLSRYDLIPFTDRIKGDPDRYRAVNPKFVQRENGHYFYDLTVKNGTHFYDEKLNDKGVLSDANIRIDLTQTIGEKDQKYFFVADKGYVPASAVEQTAEAIRDGRWFHFPLKTGAQKLYDGTGIERGEIAAGSVKLNYGLQKEIGGEIYYYAFSTKIKSGSGEIIGASGWLKASAIEAGNDPQFDQKFVSRMQMPTGAGDHFTVYEITGGEPEEISGKDASGAKIYRFGYADKNGNFVAYKVLPKIPLDGKQSVATTDYLKRGDNVVNLGFNPAGVSNDTFRVSEKNRPLIFYRSSETDATVVIDMFYPKDETHSGEEITGKMIFVYGYVAVPDGGKRWGWIPLGALRETAK